MRNPNWQQPEQLEAVNTKTGAAVFPIVPHMEYWPTYEGTYLANVDGRWFWFLADGTNITPINPYRIRNRVPAEGATSPETVRAEFDAYKREVSEAITEMLAKDGAVIRDYLGRFILPEPPAVDPLVEAIREATPQTSDAAVNQVAANIRTALAKRGLTITQAEERGE